MKKKTKLNKHTNLSSVWVHGRWYQWSSFGAHCPAICPYLPHSTDRPNSPQTWGEADSQKLWKITLNYHWWLLSNLVLHTYAVHPRLFVHPERSSFAAVCPRRGPSGHQEHTVTDKTVSVLLWTAKQGVSLDQKQWPAGTRNNMGLFGTWLWVWVCSIHLPWELYLIEHATSCQHGASSLKVDL